MIYLYISQGKKGTILKELGVVLPKNCKLYWLNVSCIKVMTAKYELKVLSDGHNKITLWLRFPIFLNLK